MANAVVDTYSRLAAEYDSEANSRSCWAQASALALRSISLPAGPCVVADVGCGSGRAMLSLSAQNRNARFFGIDPAANMRALAKQNTRTEPHIRVLDGSFEHIPLAGGSIDYLYSIFAFHWVTDLHPAVSELARVLKPGAKMDLFFIGRENGREFIRKTSPIFLRYMGPARFLEAARMRKQLTREQSLELFAGYFSPERLKVEECYRTYCDDLENHLRWWVRIEGQFIGIAPGIRAQCDEEVRKAIASLDGPEGIPYTIHQIHVRLA